MKSRREFTNVHFNCTITSFLLKQLSRLKNVMLVNIELSSVSLYAAAKFLVPFKDMVEAITINLEGNNNIINEVNELHSTFPTAIKLVKLGFFRERINIKELDFSIFPIALRKLVRQISRKSFVFFHSLDPKKYVFYKKNISYDQLKYFLLFYLHLSRLLFYFESLSLLNFHAKKSH